MLMNKLAPLFYNIQFSFTPASFTITSMADSLHSVRLEFQVLIIHAARCQSLLAMPNSPPQRKMKHDTRIKSVRSHLSSSPKRTDCHQRSILQLEFIMLISLTPRDIAVQGFLNNENCGNIKLSKGFSCIN